MTPIQLQTAVNSKQLHKLKEVYVECSKQLHTVVIIILLIVERLFLNLVKNNP